MANSVDDSCNDAVCRGGPAKVPARQVSSVVILWSAAELQLREARLIVRLINLYGLAIDVVHVLLRVILLDVEVFGRLLSTALPSRVIT